MRVVASIALLTCLAGCEYIEPGPKDAALNDAQKKALLQPSDRFVNAGKREYSNGTEIYVLDGKTGQICYFFIASGKGDATAQKTDMQSCAGSALAPEI